MRMACSCGVVSMLVKALLTKPSYTARMYKTHLCLAVALIALVMVLRGAAEHARAVMAHGTAARVQKKLRRTLYDRIAALGPGTVGRQRSGGLTLSLIDGVEQLETYFGQFLPQFLIALLSPLLIFAVVAFIDLPVAVSVFPGEIFRAPKSWAERCYTNLTYFHEASNGGHFAAWEQPRIFAEEVRAALSSGAQVKLSGFGNFDLRDKNQRPGRNPKTGEEIPISARRVVTFRPGQKLKARVEAYAGSQE